MVYLSSARRRLVPVMFSLLVAAVAAAPAAGAQTTGTQATGTQATGTQSTGTQSTGTQATGTQSGTSATTAPILPLPTPTTAPTPTTTAPAPSGAKPQPSSTTATTAPPKTPGTGVPAVPVGGPPTTAPPPGAKPPPPPDPSPILAQVDTDLAQLTAIADYKPAQALVAKAQGQVTAAGATLLSARQALDAAKKAQGQAGDAKSVADGKLRQVALAAYIGVGFTSPGLNQPPQGNGDQGAGTVSTPDGLSGISALDAKEMLILVGQHARQQDSDAAKSLGNAVKATQAAAAVVQKDQAAVSAAEARLLSAQQTLKIITTAATTPQAAAATPLADLLAADSAGKAPAPATTTTSTTTAPPTPGQPLAAAIQDAAAPVTINGAKPTSPDILGKPALDAAQLTAWWNTLNRKPNITVPIDQLINSYAIWGEKLGVRYDVAFAQSIIETGYFSFPSYGQLTDKDNNFAGIGACDTCAHGWSFPTADTGVQAQLELLREYATNAPLPAGVKNLIGTGVGGCCQTWTQLAGKWASSTAYGISIMTVYHGMLSWLIPQEEMAVGLIAPTTPKAQGPELAPLPGAPKPGGPPAAPAKPGAGAGSAPTTAPKGVSAASNNKR